jgi:hypothetical protein
MKVIRSSETSVHIRTTRRYIPEDRNFHFDNCRCENLKSYKMMSVYVYKELYGNEGPDKTIDIILLNIKPRVFCAQLDVTRNTPGIV